MYESLWPQPESLVLYQDLLARGPGAAMAAFLEAAPHGGGEARRAYLDLVRTLFQFEDVPGPTGDAWQDYVIQGVLCADNAFTRAASAGSVSRALREAAAWDLMHLQECFRLSRVRCLALVGGGVPDEKLPTWAGRAESNEAGPFVAAAFRAMARRLAGAERWADLVDELADFHRAQGFGAVARTWFLTWDGARLVPVDQPDVIDLDDLAGLEDQKKAVQENTEAFLRGGPGLNLLLYGPRGTGKSSVVRALAKRYGDAGLRLVEVGRDRLSSLGDLYRTVRRYPQRFVLFLDDLTFEADDADYRAFKSLLEGALERRPPNLVLYVTSNRRHMVPERWSDRGSPEEAEVHGQDALEERLSLADRFGRTILFLRPDQEEYLRIVEHLVARRNLPIGREEVREEARRWALWQNGLSGRTARQFVDDLEARLQAERARGT